MKSYASGVSTRPLSGETIGDCLAATAQRLPAGTVMTVNFRIAGQEFVALNGGPVFKFNESVSFVVNCATQKEIDYFWTKLSAGGQKSQCGWLKDKYGLSWQIVPEALGDLVSGKDPERGNRVMAALLKMTKLDLKKLKQAAAKK